MKQRGYTLDVFWRNVSGFGDGDIASLKSNVHQEGITPSKVAQALMRRLPPNLNLDYRRRNQRLIEHARQFKPDILWLVGDNTVITAETLATIKQATGCLLIYASGTSPIVFSHSIERQAARLYDWVLVNDYYHGIQWLELGAKEMSCLPIAAIDPDFHQPKPLTEVEQAEVDCDVTFVGTLVPNNLYSERVQALEALSQYQVGIWSVHGIPNSLEAFHRGYALGEEMMRVLSGATISVNVHGDFMRYGGNMRLFESAAMGAFQIVDNRPGISDWFTLDEHLVTFESVDDLREKVGYYLTHDAERQAIADSACEHVLKHHTYEHRLDKLESLIN